MNFRTVRFFVVVGNSTREPTEEEARAIVTYLGSGQRYLGVWPVPAVGDVWFQRVPVVAQ